MKYIKIEEYSLLNYKELETVREVLSNGGIVVFPTDSVYSMGCLMSKKKAINSILKLTGKQEKKSNLSLFFNDMKNLAEYTQNYNNTIFRAVKNLIPGPYTFIFKASKLVTKSFENSKKEVGVRIPDHKILNQVLDLFDEPLISTSLNSGELAELSNSPFALHERYKNEIDLILDQGPTQGEVTTVLDCTSEEIELIRQGIGSLNE